MTMTTAQTGGIPVETVPPKTTTLPADVHPESRNRLPLVKREDMDEQGKKAYDAVTDPNSRLKAQLIGPAGIWLHVPALSPHIREINWYLRNKVTFDPALTELIILATVRETDGQTEWTAHEAHGIKAGLDPRVVDIIKYRRPIENVTPQQAIVIKVARELIGEKHLSSSTYADALKIFGQQDLVHLILLIANYTQTSLILHAFNQQLRPDMTPLLPVVNHDNP
jgi:4-carboxymuconolactone decarboxylase